MSITMLGRLRRILPPLALFAGLFFFGVSLLVLASEATQEGPRTLDPASLTRVNDSALLVYPVEYFGARSAHINVTYAFPQAPGEVYFVGCDDIARLRAGEAPLEPLLAFTGLQRDTFLISHQTVTTRDPFYTIDQERGGSRYACDPAVVFRWTVDGDLGANRPEARLMYHSAQLDGESFAFLALLMGGAALSTLLGGLAWVRARSPPAVWPASDDSTVETLRASLERMGSQLERTRKYLLLAGVLGVFLWYPFVIPWTWQQAARASDDPLIPWGAAALTLVFLGVLTALWAREFLRLDRELNAWRDRIGELQARETYLMDALESDGG